MPVLGSNLSHARFPVLLAKQWALSIQQNFRFEISEIPHALWNGTFRLHGPDPSHCAFGYCSCKQNSKERYWGQQLRQMERDNSVRPTEMRRSVKVDHLQRKSQIFRSDRTEMVCSIWFLTEISGILGWMESALRHLLITTENSQLSISSYMQVMKIIS